MRVRHTVFASVLYYTTERSLGAVVGRGLASERDAEAPDQTLPTSFSFLAFLEHRTQQQDLFFNLITRCEI